MATTNSNFDSSYINWSAVIAGTVVALAITLILIPFGNSVGLSFTTQLVNEKRTGMSFGISLWVFWTQLIASIFGGYFAGKAAGNYSTKHNHEYEFRDGTHGLLAWGLSTILTAIGLAVIGFLSSLAPHTTAEVNAAAQSLARKTTVLFGFTVAASALVSAVAAWYYATIAGDHRTNSVDLSRHLSFKRAKK